MFCPRCSTTNPDQKYCRQCGLHLTAVRHTLEGRTNEAMAKLKKGEASVRGGVITSGIFVLIALVGCVIAPLFDRDYTGWQLLLTLLLNFALGLVFGLPSILMGLRRLRQAGELLDTQQQPARPLTANQPVQLPAADLSMPVAASPPAAASVTEHTTLNLKSPE